MEYIYSYSRCVSTPRAWWSSPPSNLIDAELDWADLHPQCPDLTFDYLGSGHSFYATDYSKLNFHNWQKLAPTVLPGNALVIGAHEGRCVVALQKYIPQLKYVSVIELPGDRDSSAAFGRSLVLNRVVNGRVYYGASAHVLPLLKAECQHKKDGFTFIYVNGSKYAEDNYLDLLHALTLVGDGGVILIDDFEWAGTQDTWYAYSMSKPKRGIWAALALFSDTLEVLPLDELHFQLALRKTQARGVWRPAPLVGARIPLTYRGGSNEATFSNTPVPMPLNHACRNFDIHNTLERLSSLQHVSFAELAAPVHRLNVDIANILTNGTGLAAAGPFGRWYRSAFADPPLTTTIAGRTSRGLIGDLSPARLLKWVSTSEIPLRPEDAGCTPIDATLKWIASLGKDNAEISVFGIDCVWADTNYPASFELANWFEWGSYVLADRETYGCMHLGIWEGVSTRIWSTILPGFTHGIAVDWAPDLDHATGAGRVNIALTNCPYKMIWGHTGYVLPMLYADAVYSKQLYSFMYYDASKHSYDLAVDLEYLWRMLAKGGIIVLAGYNWNRACGDEPAAYAINAQRRAVNVFLHLHSGHYELLPGVVPTKALAIRRTVSHYQLGGLVEEMAEGVDGQQAVNVPPAETPMHVDAAHGAAIGRRLDNWLEWMEWMGLTKYLPRRAERVVRDASRMVGEGTMRVAESTSRALTAAATYDSGTGQDAVASTLLFGAHVARCFGAAGEWMAGRK